VWLRQKTHNQEVVDSNLDTAEDAIYMSHSFGSIEISGKNVLGIVAYAIILQMGGWTLRTVYL